MAYFRAALGVPARENINPLSAKGERPTNLWSYREDVAGFDQVGLIREEKLEQVHESGP